MVLVVEDGTGVQSAESYISLDAANTYLLGHTLLSADWFVLSSVDRERALRVASQWIDAQFGIRFVGARQSTRQGLAWPRYGYHPGSGLEIVRDEVPKRLRDAVCEAAAVWAQGGGEIPLTVESVGCTPTPSTSNPAVEKETVKVGPITISQEFSSGGQVTTTTTNEHAKAYPLVERMLLGAELIERFDRAATSFHVLERF